MKTELQTDQIEAIKFLSELVETPSISGEEEGTALIIEKWFKSHGITCQREKNNLWALNKHFDPEKPTILLNSHHDTVKPNDGYTKSPFKAQLEDGKLYGLGSNDAGASLVSLMHVFKHYYEDEKLKYNLLIAATAEEEISGSNGIHSILHHFPEIEFALVGEPTSMRLAISEKGLVVIDAYAKGISGHAAHGNSENAIYKAIPDIEWINSFQFPKTSSTLGPVKMSVTQISAGKQHNVVPDSCHFVVDVRVNDCYSNREIVGIIDANTSCDIEPRSLRLNSSGIDPEHQIVKAAMDLGIVTFGSPTLSDQALIPFPSVKIGPGDTKRSHQPNEFIYVDELIEGMKNYKKLLNQILYI